MVSTPILITGAGGWLGRRLLLALTRGLPDYPSTSIGIGADRIRCLSPPGEESERLAALSRRIEVFTGDLRNAQQMDAFCRSAEGGLLFHLAGVVHPTLFVRDFFSVNVRGGANLFEAAERNGVGRVVVMSSSSPFGSNPDRGHRFDEASPYRPTTGYARSKMQLERLAGRLSARGRVETVVVRAPWFYGPCQPARQTEFFRLIRKGRAPIVGDGENLRSMVYVDNLCQGLLLCGQHPEAAGETYWVADREPYTMNRIVDVIERVMEHDFGMDVAHRRLRLPSIVSALARAGDRLLQTAGLYMQRLHVLGEMTENIACSIEKAERELGYVPVVELEEGMRRSIRWCLDEARLDP